MTIDEIKDILLTEAEYSQDQIDNIDGWDLIDAWLKWQGIIGYTSDVITAVLSVNKHMSLADWAED